MNGPGAGAASSARATVEPSSALARHAERAPEAPFLFFRGERGHFAWWSWARSRAVAAGEPIDSAPGAAAARDYLTTILRAGERERERATAVLEGLGAGPRRDIWLTRGASDSSLEAPVAVAALAGGWAVVLEPGETIHPATWLWARPTVVAGGASEIERLVEACEREAPRWRRQRWLSRRLSRLRAVVVPDLESVPRLEVRFASVGAAPRILPLASSGW